MNNEENDELIEIHIGKALNTRSEELTKDFYDVAWNLPRWHLLMLQDRHRLEYYRNVITPKVKGKIVLDVGTGSGILSHLALKAGARKVYSVEQNPALIAVYRHLMKIPLEQGQAELISNDANNLRLEQFSEGPPEVIVHELFGSIGMGEYLIPIFRSFREEGILTDKSVLIPDQLEVWSRPVWSEILSKEAHLDAFEGYPLEKLNIFGHQNIWEQEYNASLASDWKSAGDDQLVFSCNLHDLNLPDTVKLSFVGTHCSHLKFWMKVVDTSTGLIHEDDHQKRETHWANAYLSIPPWFRGKSFQVEFKIFPNSIQLLRFY
jgi:hypothetical protein